MGGKTDTKPAPTKPLLTKWRFLQLDNSIQRVGNHVFQVMQLTDGVLYRWQNGRKWYSAKVKNNEAAWVVHQLAIHSYLEWCVEDKESLF